MRNHRSLRRLGPAQDMDWGRFWQTLNTTFGWDKWCHLGRSVNRLNGDQQDGPTEKCWSQKSRSIKHFQYFTADIETLSRAAVTRLIEEFYNCLIKSAICQVEWINTPKSNLKMCLEKLKSFLSKNSFYCFNKLSIKFILWGFTA